MESVALTNEQWAVVLGSLVYAEQNQALNATESEPFFKTHKDIERQLGLCAAHGDRLGA